MAEHDNLEDPIVAHHAEDVIQAKPKRSFRSYIWDSLDKSPEERHFLFKLDSAVLTFATLGKLLHHCYSAFLTQSMSGYFIKYLDQSNINNAFVSGMYVSQSFCLQQQKSD